MMWLTIFGIFLCLHGMVHGLYAAQSWRLFELQPGLVFPDHSWIFSRFLGVEAIRIIGAVAFILVALAYLSGGMGVFFRAEWQRPVAAVAAIASTVFYLLFWDGKFQSLPDQGWVGILLNLGVLAVVYLVK